MPNSLFPTGGSRGTLVGSEGEFVFGGGSLLLFGGPLDGPCACVCGMEVRRIVRRRRNVRSVEGVLCCAFLESML